MAATQHWASMQYRVQFKVLNPSLFYLYSHPGHQTHQHLQGHPHNFSQKLILLKHR